VLVLLVAGLGASRAEHADRRSDLAQRLEAGSELPLDQLEALVVGARRMHRRRFGLDDLLAEGGRLLLLGIGHQRQIRVRGRD
jgi:hypothetical protein